MPGRMPGSAVKACSEEPLSRLQPPRTNLSAVPTMNNFNLPALGGGAGLRHEHFQEIIDKKPPFRWFEVIAEDFIGFGGYVKECLTEIRKNYRIIPHGVNLSIGSTDELNVNHIKSLRKFLDQIDAPWTSDHLCFTMVDHTNLVDLMPLPFTQEAVDHVVARVKKTQAILERPFLLENVTRYITVSDREMPEHEFITRVIEGANCGLLLDVTNVFLNSQFHGYDAWEFICRLPLERVGQIHLAGWENKEHVIDSHDAPVPAEVWELFEKVIARIGPTSVLVEWDKLLPPVERLLEETRMADDIMYRYGFEQDDHKAAGA